MAREYVDLYWSPRDFSDALMNAVGCIDDGKSLPHPCMLFDRSAATEPEDAKLPISYWTKRRILFYVDECRSVDSSVCAILKKMSLGDIRAVTLKFVGKRVTGNLHTFSGSRYRGEWRNTSYYSLDVEGLNGLTEVKL